MNIRKGCEPTFLQRIKFMNEKLEGVGLGLRSKHYQHVLKNKPKVNWFEVHSENFFAEGGLSMHILEEVAKQYPLSFHGVGLSLGSADGLDETHLKKLKRLVDNFNPALVSEHISWSNVSNVVMNDLLPLPYTKESLEVLCDNIKHLQDYLSRQVLVENPSSYLEFKDSTMAEDEFINKVLEKTGCGLLLDVNNIYVSSVNHNFDAIEYIKNIPDSGFVQEIHLAGHEKKALGDDRSILVDTHSDKVIDEVWELYKFALEKFGQVPTLIEWDNDIPEFDILAEEGKKAQMILDEV